jgi:TPR repeat protein
MVMKRVEANDPNALCRMGALRYHEGDNDSAVEYYKKAAGLGDAAAHYELGLLYTNLDGQAVEEDEEKMVHHWEKAAIGGHPKARYCLGRVEEAIGNIERAVKHFIIAAKLGHEGSMKELWKYYSAGNITKENLDATLRSHQSAIDATKSLQREEAEAFHQQMAESRR